MAIDVYLPHGWQRLGIEQSHISSEARSIGELIELLEQRWPLLAKEWRGKNTPLVSHLKLFINGEQLAKEGAEAQELSSGDCVDVLLPISGG
ncbi:MAG: MoaD/ThiS family protein [Synechococcus lacustris]